MMELSCFFCGKAMEFEDSLKDEIECGHIAICNECNITKRGQGGVIMNQHETYRFYEGEEVKALFWLDGTQIMVGHGGVAKITVVMEYGQMAGVPWFAVWNDHKIVSKHNAAHIASVDL